MTKFKLILFGILLLLCYTCKKPNSYYAHPFEIQAIGLTTKTTVNLTVLGNYGATIMSQKNVGNGTYDSFIDVNPGDKITVNISSTIPDNKNGDGEGTFKYYFNGHQIGAYGGPVMSWNETLTIPTP